jgi:DNA repair exonuclease SbcCD nuclease subunit
LITAILTSDNHLGLYYDQMRPDCLEKRRHRLRDAFTRVVDAAIDRQVDLFLHAGDLFDRPDPRNAERRFVARQLQRLNHAGIPVVAIAGNHDSPRSYGYDGGVTPHEEIAALGAIHLFRNSDQLESLTLTLRSQRVTVWGMTSDFNRASDACPLQGVEQRRERPDDIAIILLHYSVEGWQPPFAREPCLSRANLSLLDADVIGVGHLHAPNQTCLPGGAMLLNPGATEHMDFGEERHECGFYALTITPGSTDAEYVRLTPQPMQTLELHVPDDVTRTPTTQQEEEIAARLMADFIARLEAASHPDQLLRLKVTGQITRTLLHRLDLLALDRRAQTGNFHCRTDTTRLVTCEPVGDLTVSGGVGFDILAELQHAAQECAERTGDNAAERELYHLAGEALAAAYDRIIKGA